MIDPATKRDGEPYLEYNERRWGGDGWTSTMRKMGRKEGAPYKNWVTWPNTTHCGRLLLLAEKHGLAGDVIGRLYRACYEEGENVSLRPTVARIAREAGVPGGEEYVNSDAGLLELSEHLQGSTCNGKRVRSAPTFGVRVAGATYDFSGARETEEWLSILEQCADYAGAANTE
jgi:predicted DsbA family dithiol-disulfide isomerase